MKGDTFIINGKKVLASSVKSIRVSDKLAEKLLLMAERFEQENERKRAEKGA